MNCRTIRGPDKITFPDRLKFKFKDSYWIFDASKTVKNFWVQWPDRYNQSIKGINWHPQ